MTQTADNVGRGLSDPMDDLGHGLYAFTDPGPMATRLYVLSQDPVGMSPTPSFETFWKTGIGWCLFTPADLSKIDIEIFTRLAREKLPAITPSTGNASYIVWLSDPYDFDNPIWAQWVYQTHNQAVGASTSTFPCDRIAVELSAQIGTLTLLLNDGVDGGPPTVTLLTAPNFFALTVDGTIQTVGLPINATQPSASVWACQLALSGPQAGSLAMPIALDLGTLADQFGFETTYQYLPSLIENDPGADSTLQTVRMALFAPQTSAPTDQDGFCAFNMLVNPFHPHAAEASGIRVDRAGRLLSGATASEGSVQARQVDNARALVSAYGAASDGSVLTLTPADPVEEKLAFDAYVGGGFAYSARKAPPQAATSTTPMSPAGVFVPAAPDGTGDQRALPQAAAVDVMPGLFALDFVRLAVGDRLQFEPGHAAYIAPVETTSRASVQSDATTSYVSVVHGTATDGRGYFGQSSTANLYLAADNAPAGVLSAALAELSPLNKTPPFPMLFVGALFLDHPESGPINPELTARLVERLDQKVIGPKRHAALLDAPDGPKVQLPNNVSTRLRSAVEPTTHPVVTPQGYIVDVDGTGIFTDITLGVGTGTAISPNALRFDGGGTPKKVAPEVSTLLTRENLFLVATKTKEDWNFQNHIRVAGFEFSVSLDGPGSLLQKGEDPAILIIKLDGRRSLRDMATDPTSWTNGGDYVGNVDKTVARLQALFKAADNPDTPVGEDPFTAFRTILDQKSWTGVIAFDTPIDGNGMPSDLQMLLGGIPGQLRAHHVGIQTNKISDIGPGGSSVAQSSVFGVINYQRGPHQDPVNGGTGPEYEVAEMIAQIGNSALVQLHVTVDLIVHQLLGRAVSLPVTKEDPEGNTLSIKGRYQKHGDVGRVVFVTDTAFVFTPVKTGEGVIRVIDSIRVSHASLVPVTGTTDGPKPQDGENTDTHVEAHFTLAGQIFFDDAPFGTEDRLDLFSYGLIDFGPDKITQGLNFSGLTVAVAFDLSAEGSMTPGSKTVDLLESTLTPAATPSAVRPQSLLGSLPLQLTSFEVADKKANTSVGSKAKPVNVLQLTASPPNLKARKKLVNQQDKGEDVEPLPMPVSPYTTTSPAYGLKYEVSLGSLGELSSVHGGLSAALTIAWGPSPTVPDNDAAAVFIELPSLAAGYQGFDLQGFISTRFESANLLKVKTDDDRIVYAMSFDNVQLAVFGYGLPPGVLVDFLLFSGNQSGTQQKVTDASSIGWVLSATTDKKAS